MIEKDFESYGIRHFTPAEIEATGAKLADVCALLMIDIEEFRDKIGRCVCLLPNGLTSGKHKSKEHKNGIAVDVAFREQDGPVDVVAVFKAALAAGFHGIGIYWNGVAYSFHFDLRGEYAFWTGRKAAPGTGEWEYGQLIIDPAKA